jgi:hypothetical protein
MFVGEAAALGLAIKVPILVRSLADSMSITTSGPSLQFHESMLAVLDNGLPAEDPCALVPDYACDWWNNDAEPDAGQIMSSTNLARLLAIHETHRPISDLQVQSPASSGPEPACSHCHEYRDLAAEAVGELESMLQYADAMQSQQRETLRPICDGHRVASFFTKGSSRKKCVKRLRNRPPL